MVESTEEESKNRKCRQDQEGQEGFVMFKSTSKKRYGHWSSSTSMELGSKSICKKRYGQAAQAWRWGQKVQARRYMVEQLKHGVG